MAEEVRVNPQFDERDVEIEGSIGTLESFNAPVVNADVTEIEVDPVIPTTTNNGVRYVEVRVNRPVEEMSFVAGNKVNHYTFEEGHRYQVPRPVALELEAIGAVWH